VGVAHLARGGRSCSWALYCSPPYTIFGSQRNSLGQTNKEINNLENMKENQQRNEGEKQLSYDPRHCPGPLPTVLNCEIIRFNPKLNFKQTILSSQLNLVISFASRMEPVQSALFFYFLLFFFFKSAKNKMGKKGLVTENPYGL